MTMPCHRPLNATQDLQIPPRPTAVTNSHVRLPKAALINASQRWGSVGKHLFPRHAPLHLSGVTASACKQGSANCLSLFLWYQGRANKQTGEFYTTASETFSQCCRRQVVSSPYSCNSSMYTWKHGDMKANVHNFTHIAWPVFFGAHVTWLLRLLSHVTVFVVVSKWPRQPLVWFSEIVFHIKYLKLQEEWNPNDCAITFSVCVAGKQYFFWKTSTHCK